MTQSSPQPPGPPAGGPGEAKADATGTAVGSRSRLVRLTREGRTRWVALGVVVAIGGGAAVVAVAHEHREHVVRGRFAAGELGHGRGEKPADGRMGMKQHMGGKPEIVDGDRAWPGRGPGPERRAQGAAKAPVPLPALPAAQALEKAVGAVEGGKVESLRAVPQEGGGSAWLAVVLGPDGVRHAVTLAGADGTVTGNTPAAKTAPHIPR
ncbi:hypothetical protein ABZZ20_02660 [Streptomyces sp. NPDC006430]|uniref:hypothetical protein n=1 Tax=Streptomyces sp. NPDC006430 TaxID=3154299 RepID=UPI0033BA8BEC